LLTNLEQNQQSSVSLATSRNAKAETAEIKTDVEVICFERGAENWFMGNGKGREQELAEKALACHIWGTLSPAAGVHAKGA